MTFVLHYLEFKPCLAALIQFFLYSKPLICVLLKLSHTWMVLFQERLGDWKCRVGRPAWQVDWCRSTNIQCCQLSLRRSRLYWPLHPLWLVHKLPFITIHLNSHVIILAGTSWLFFSLIAYSAENWKVDQDKLYTLCLGLCE